jgi:histidinol dehydrogenase
MELIKVVEFPDKHQWSKLVIRPQSDNLDIEQRISSILNEVKNSGDEALRIFSKKFDRIDLSSFEVSEKEFHDAHKNIPETLKISIGIAKCNIEKFHSSQKEETKIIETTSGVNCWRKSVAIEKVGLYVPGGTAPLFSTVLMLGIPAMLAGCKEIIICTPPGKDGSIHPAILYAADLIGIKTIYKTGGAQAIAAMAYGTESIPKVYKIFGPGNVYVTTAKQMVNRAGISIDMPAGPSEVAILADHTCEPSFVASEILSQAEHGNNSQAMVVCTDKATAQLVTIELAKQFENLSRKEHTSKGREASMIVLMEDMNSAISFINEYAPEHLVIQADNEDEIASRILNAGSVFIGKYTPVAAGDYGSGTNHTLPTNGFAKAYSGVSLDSFLKKITFQKITEEGIRNLGIHISVMAEGEGLDAHKKSVEIRTSFKKH